jgi:hypothetical protein
MPAGTSHLVPPRGCAGEGSTYEDLKDFEGPVGLKKDKNNHEQILLQSYR